MKNNYVPAKPRPAWLNLMVILCMALGIVFMVTSIIAYFGLSSQLEIDSEMAEMTGMDEDYLRLFITQQLILFRIILVPCMLILLVGQVLMLLRRKAGLYLTLAAELIPVIAFVLFVIPQSGRKVGENSEPLYVLPLLEVIFYILIPVLFSALFFFFRKSFLRNRVVEAAGSL